jgi:hypothetical protein
MNFLFILLLLSCIAQSFSQVETNPTANLNSPGTKTTATKKKANVSKKASTNDKSKGPSIVKQEDSGLYRRSPTRPGRGKTLKNLEHIKERNEEVEKTEAAENVARGSSASGAKDLRNLQSRGEKDLQGLRILQSRGGKSLQGLRNLQSRGGKDLQELRNLQSRGGKRFEAERIAKENEAKEPIIGETISSLCYRSMLQRVEAERIAKENEANDFIGVTIQSECKHWYHQWDMNFAYPPHQMTKAELTRMSPDDATNGGVGNPSKRAKLSSSTSPPKSADETLRLVLNRKDVPRVVQELISSFSTSCHDQRKEATAKGTKQAGIAIRDTVKSRFSRGNTPPDWKILTQII